MACHLGNLPLCLHRSYYFGIREERHCHLGSIDLNWAKPMINMVGSVAFYKRNLLLIIIQDSYNQLLWLNDVPFKDSIPCDSCPAAVDCHHNYLVIVEVH